MNESATIAGCITALIGEAALLKPITLQVIVAANGCMDDTAGIARRLVAQARCASMDLVVLEQAAGGKCRAINAAERIATGDIRIYLDSDVRCESGLVAALARRLDSPRPRFASGTVVPVHRGGWFVSRYAWTWVRLPFNAKGVSGCGLYAVNRAGRALWKKFPEILADDKFVRLHFPPAQRLRVEQCYYWPLPNAFRDLTRTRARWSRGNIELRRRHPELTRNDDNRCPPLAAILGLVTVAPVSLAAFAFVWLVARLRAVRMFQPSVVWTGGAQRRGIEEA